MNLQPSSKDKVKRSYLLRGLWIGFWVFGAFVFIMKGKFAWALGTIAYTYIVGLQI